MGWREAQLNALADEIAAGGPSRPLVIPMDLTRVDAPVRIGHELGARGLEPEIMVNNAGFGLVGRAAELDRGEQLAMIDLNVRALTDLSLRFIENLARHRGGILNVASISAFMPAPGDGGLQRHQGLRAVVERGAALRAGAAWGAGHDAVLGARADRVPAARRHPRRPAAHAGPLAGSGGAAGL